MQRYFVAPEQFLDGAVIITGEDAHHAVRVMRMKPNDRFIACDGAGRTALAAVTEAGAQEVRAAIVDMLPRDSEPLWQITIAQSLPKGDKMELVIQKGTEIGAAAFVPFQSERMIVQYDGKKEAKRLERWGKIAKEAAEQSHRHRIPPVEPVRSWKELLGIVPDFDLALFCYERAGDEARGTGIATAIKRWRAGAEAPTAAVDAERAAEKTPDRGDVPETAQAGAALPHAAGDAAGLRTGTARILLIAGPEGGFTEREAREAEAAGAVLTGLGKRILRAETAGIVGLTCLLYESGEMEGA